MAAMLVESMAGEWDPEAYHDDYRDALLEWIESKARKGDLAPATGAHAERGREREPAVINIMDLLRKSVEQSKKPRRSASRMRTASARRKHA